jgi:diacylglycerol kinase (ATP)
VSTKFLAIVNPAAGGGKSGQLAAGMLEKVRQTGIALTVVHTARAGQATDLARQAYREGTRNFLAVGGDGTSFEIINGLFPAAESHGRPTLGLLPLGTGNSFLKDFTKRGVEHTLAALKNNSRRPCDVIHLRHAEGELYFLNLLTLGFPADVAETTNRRFKRWGELGYILGVFTRLVQLEHLAFPHRLAEKTEQDRNPALSTTVNSPAAT